MCSHSLGCTYFDREGFVLDLVNTTFYFYVCCLNYILVSSLPGCALDVRPGKIYSVLMIVMWKVNSFIPALGAPCAPWCILNVVTRQWLTNTNSLLFVFVFFFLFPPFNISFSEEPYRTLVNNSLPYAHTCYSPILLFLLPSLS